MPDVIDFLVLRQQFDNARKRQWSIGQPVLPLLTDLLKPHTEFVMNVKHMTDTFLLSCTLFIKSKSKLSVIFG